MTHRDNGVKITHNSIVKGCVLALCLQVGVATVLQQQSYNVVKTALTRFML
jgi:hypothetical protein